MKIFLTFYLVILTSKSLDCDDSLIEKLQLPISSFIVTLDKEDSDFSFKCDDQKNLLVNFLEKSALEINFMQSEEEQCFIIKQIYLPNSTYTIFNCEMIDEIKESESDSKPLNSFENKLVEELKPLIEFFYEQNQEKFEMNGIFEDIIDQLYVKEPQDTFQYKIPQIQMIENNEINFLEEMDKEIKIQGETGEFRKLFMKKYILNYNLFVEENEDYFLLSIEGIHGKFETMIDKHPIGGIAQEKHRYLQELAQFFENALDLYLTISNRTFIEDQEEQNLDQEKINSKQNSQNISQVQNSQSRDISQRTSSESNLKSKVISQNKSKVQNSQSKVNSQRKQKLSNSNSQINSQRISQQSNSNSNSQVNSQRISEISNSNTKSSQNKSLLKKSTNSSHSQTKKVSGQTVLNKKERILDGKNTNQKPQSQDQSQQSINRQNIKIQIGELGSTKQKKQKEDHSIDSEENLAKKQISKISQTKISQRSHSHVHKQISQEHLTTKFSKNHSKFLNSKDLSVKKGINEHSQQLTSKQMLEIQNKAKLGSQQHSKTKVSNIATSQLKSKVSKKLSQNDPKNQKQELQTNLSNSDNKKLSENLKKQHEIQNGSQIKSKHSTKTNLLKENISKNVSGKKHESENAKLNSQRSQTKNLKEKVSNNLSVHDQENAKLNSQRSQTKNLEEKVSKNVSGIKHESENLLQIKSKHSSKTKQKAENTKNLSVQKHESGNLLQEKSKHSTKTKQVTENTKNVSGKKHESENVLKVKTKLSSQGSQTKNLKENLSKNVSQVNAKLSSQGSQTKNLKEKVSNNVSGKKHESENLEKAKLSSQGSQKQNLKENLSKNVSENKHESENVSQVKSQLNSLRSQTNLEDQKSGQLQTQQKKETQNENQQSTKSQIKISEQKQKKKIKTNQTVKIAKIEKDVIYNLPSLKLYSEKNQINFPIACLIVHEVIQKTEILENEIPQKIKLINNLNPEQYYDEEKNPIPTLQSMPTDKWFYLNGDLEKNPEVFGPFYEEQDPELYKYQEQYPNFQEYFSEFVNDYFLNSRNFLELTYGDSNIHRKFVVQLFGWENSFYKSVHLIMITQYFQVEHIIPLGDFQLFSHEVQKHLKEALYHYHEVIANLDGISHKTTININMEKIRQLISVMVEDEIDDYCFIEHDDRNLEFKLKKTSIKDFCLTEEKVNKHKLEKAKELQQCQENEEFITLFKVSKIFDENEIPMFSFTFQQLYQDEQAENKLSQQHPTQTKHQVYSYYPFDIYPQLKKNILKGTCGISFVLDKKFKNKVIEHLFTKKSPKEHKYHHSDEERILLQKNENFVQLFY